ncbi:MAG: GNAT family N-acetyltransferase [Saprospiraceae bacterium]
MQSEITVREVEKNDIQYIVGYWNNASTEDLLAMGIDVNNIDTLKNLGARLEKQLMLSNEDKAAFVLVALLDKKPIGHCYVNNLIFGKEAFMHLHIWQNNSHKKGMGSAMVRQSIPYFFEKLKLQTLFCEPAAMNLGPNKTLEKIGFKFIKKYTTIPAGWTFQMEVNRWEMTLDYFKNKFNS